MNEDDPGYALAIKIQAKHLRMTGQHCDLPPPPEVMDLYVWSPRLVAKRAQEEATARAKWKELSAEEKEVARIWNPTLYKKLSR